MPFRLRNQLSPCIGAICLSLALSAISPAEEVWSGLTYQFTHPSGGANADEITGNVALNRGTTGGLFNSAYEGNYVDNLSPEFTQWATEFNNAPETEIELDNRTNLIFTDWRAAYGGPGELATNITTGKAIVFLELDEIYLELQFQSWGQGFGGGGEFSYVRSAPPVTTPTGDYNGNSFVDAADYTIWRNTLGSMDDLRANGDNTGLSAGIIDQADYAFWKMHFGTALGNGSGASAAGSVVPEPALNASLAGIAMLVLTAVRLRPSRATG